MKLPPTLNYTSSINSNALYISIYIALLDMFMSKNNINAQFPFSLYAMEINKDLSVWLVKVSRLGQNIHYYRCLAQNTLVVIGSQNRKLPRFTRKNFYVLIWPTFWSFYLGNCEIVLPFVSIKTERERQSREKTII